MRRFLKAALFCVLLAPGYASAKGTAGASICERAAARAETAHGLPSGLLTAISIVETSRTSSGTRKPWPWTVNVSGRGHYFDDQESAKRYVAKQLGAGVRSMDIGCFQINTKWHSENFPSVPEMFNANLAADYAAKFLAKLHAQRGDWLSAVAAYHSRAPKRGAVYRKKVVAALAETKRAETKRAEKENRLKRPPLRTVEAPKEAGVASVQLVMFSDRPPLIDREAGRKN
ncbi:MAG: lytic transglycosylase domain-containing protein [Pseudomonadota bacterium]